MQNIDVLLHSRCDYLLLTKDTFVRVLTYNMNMTFENIDVESKQLRHLPLFKVDII